MSTQAIQVLRDGRLSDAVASWRMVGDDWIVEITSAAFGAVRAQASDAFEALFHIRDELEPQGWRIGVAGALANVWASGMARDQGGGLRAYVLTEKGAESLVDTFAPVHPTTVVTVAEQRAEVDRLQPTGRH